MNQINSKTYWENIYETKDTSQVGWFQPQPQLSMSLIAELSLGKNSKVIDIGGGDSSLIDHLLENKYRNLTVLDISAKAMEKATQRLGEKSTGVEWIVSDIRDFEPANKYDLWHDRAAFHFLIEDEDIEKYLTITKKSIREGGFMIIGTFSDKGPNTCSGLPVKQYSLEELENLFSPSFEIITRFNTDHITPSGQPQNYSFCVFRKK
jgi:cyclopropane fatty-acyl-phospholipid synthase-like methyltransferase